MGAIELDNEKACEWVELSLKAGHRVSAAVLSVARLGEGRFRTFADRDISHEQLPEFPWGGVTTTHHADMWLARVLDGLNQKGAKCLIVEDNLSHPTDPALIRSEIPSAFIGDRVVSWSDLGPEDGKTAIDEVIRVSNGYPLNAFVATRSARELDLADRQQVPKDFPEKVAKSLLAVIVAIFDAESYLVWDDLQGG